MCRRWGSSDLVTMNRPTKRGATAPLLLAGSLLATLLLSIGCGGSEVEGGEESQSASQAEKAPMRLVERDRSEAANALRKALDLGELGEIDDLFEAARPTLGVEALLLDARLYALYGRDLNVTPKIEEARAEAPEDPRVYATSAELHAASGRLDTARAEIRRGLDACGSAPELLRAQAFVQLSQQGGAERGLALLVQALQYDADLPFCARAKAQAHLLLAKKAMSERRTKTALEQVELSLASDPFDIDARLFFADALAANGEFPDAVSVLEQLETDGEDRGGELALMYKRAAMAELLLRQRDRAIEYFRLARESGLSDEELGTGADILNTAATQAMEEGVKAFAQDDLDAARVHFERALGLDNGLLVCHSQLAVVLFRQGKNLPAATHWRTVLDVSIEEELDLPDPVHIFLAKALYAADEKLAAKAALEAYLEREPEGRWREQTEALLGEL